MQKTPDNLHANGNTSASRWAMATALFFSFTTACSPSAAAEKPSAAERPPCGSFDHGHGAWNGILKERVQAGVVDYRGLLKHDRQRLHGYLASMEGVCKSEYGKWSDEQKLAFWINAYNAYTVKLILDNYPLKSIRTIGTLPGAAWRQKIVAFERLMGKRLSLEHVEHEIIRKRFEEPRIHFALVCAAKSCPPLRSEAYQARELTMQLDEQAESFLGDRRMNRFDPASRTLHLSRIFDWYKEDFGTDDAALARYAAKYLPKPHADVVKSGKVKVKFLDYDWSLNGR